MIIRSYITMDEGNGKYRRIYCHFEDGVGKTLVDNYNTPEKVSALLDLGDLSMLGQTPDDCVAYGRDRGEERTEADIITKQTLIDDSWSVDYVYTFVPNTNKWGYFIGGEQFMGFRSVEADMLED